MTVIYYIFFTVAMITIILAVWELTKKKKKSNPIPKLKIISTTTPKKGVRVDILKEGQGKEATSGSIVKVHYTAWLENGTKVDSSHDKGEVFSFTMGRRQVIPGWEAGMLGMLEGEKRKFTIAPDQAYGAEGKANVPPNSTIIFEVELLQII